MSKIISRFLFVLLMFSKDILFGSTTDYSIVLVHIGNHVPHYVEKTVSQIRLFNEKCPVYLVTNQAAIPSIPQGLSDKNLTVIPCESLRRTAEHDRFLRETPNQGFWMTTSERFFYLDELMNEYDLKNVFHMEYDNMLYVNLEELLPIFTENYPGIAATFDNDNRCIPGFVYIANSEIIRKLASSFAEFARNGHNDMQAVAVFKNRTSRDAIDHLPIIMNTYAQHYPMITNTGSVAGVPESYFNHIDLFKSIFDAAALGQYLGGVDPIHGPITPGFINESCVFNPSYLTFEWHKDTLGRKVPFAIFKNEKYRINNLHIHSKELYKFYSKEE